MYDNNALLDVMLKDQRDQHEIYQPGPYWQNYSTRMQKGLRKYGLVNFRSNPKIGKGFADTITIDPVDMFPPDSWKHNILRTILSSGISKRLILRHYHDRLHWWYGYAQNFKDLYWNRVLGEWFSEFSHQHDLPDMLVGRPNRIVNLNGIEVAEGYLTAFSRISNRQDHVSFNKIHSVFEIGGGYGALAHSLLHLYPNIRKYVYLDIPPTIYVATQYLRNFYGESVIAYDATRSSENICFSPDDRLEIIAICPWQIEKLRTEIDLFWNSASFQEMPVPVVNNYLHHVARVLCKGDKGVVNLDVYDNGDPTRTLSIERLKNIASELFLIDEVKNRVHFQSEHCYIGRMKPQLV